MKSNVALKAINISKAYQLGEIGTGTISRDMERWWAKVRGKADPIAKIGEVNDRTKSANSDVIWSLKDINFEIEQGEAIGIIGPNGAGKSTLLKILSKITSPTTGKIVGRGRIASLLEIGTGFNPELTGRENIFLNGSILGMRKNETLRKLDEIVDFAGVAKYLDTPVKRYSSGMYIRLAFAVAAHLESEILLVDEVLAVGDAEFQAKCLGKMESVTKTEGRTILFVSHNMGSISELCQKSILLNQGQLKRFDHTNLVIGEYISGEFSEYPKWEKLNDRYYSPFFDLLAFQLVDGSKNQNLAGVVKNDDLGGVYIKFEVKEQHPNLCYGIAVYTQQEQLLFWSYQTDKAQNDWVQPHIGINEVIIWLPKRILNEGAYKIKVIASLHFIKWIILHKEAPHINLQIVGGLSDSPIWNDARPGLLAPVLNFEKI
jgi:lipopolysaccharide transport system ATP-binding protein